MTMTAHHGSHLTTQQFRAAFVLIYALFGVVVLLIWAGLGFSS
jgi:hypothetical protein